MSHASKIVEVTLRCTLSALIDLAGTKVPADLAAHPDVRQVATNRLTMYVDMYHAFLRKEGVT